MDILSRPELSSLRKFSKHLLADLNKPHLCHSDIADYIERFSQHAQIKQTTLGTSLLGKSISLFTLGSGATHILLWTQMHGDEPTATAAVFDLMHMLTNNIDTSFPADWQQQLTIHILPMLNPDGADMKQRQNAQGIDINRDALALQTPEGRILHALLTGVTTGRKPTYAFNLHDQDAYYRTGENGNAVTLALLAPAYNYQKHIDGPRRKAMGLIGSIFTMLDAHFPQKTYQNVARYDDEFSPRSFGDQAAAMSIATILIESGHYPNDPTRQVARVLTLASLLHGLTAVYNERKWAFDKTLKGLEDKYWRIPRNLENYYCDLLITQLKFTHHNFKSDIAIRRASKRSQDFVVHEIGHLRHMCGHRVFEGAAYVYEIGKAYEITEPVTLYEHDYIELLKQGFTHFVGATDKINNMSAFPIVTPSSQTVNTPSTLLSLGTVPSGLLTENKTPRYALLGNQIISLT